MSMVITWANRHRTLQADTAVEWLAGDTGLEAGQHSALQVFDASHTLLAEKLDIDGESALVESDQTGPFTFKLWSIRDGFQSYQVNEWTWTQDAPDAVSGTVITAVTWVEEVDVVIIDGGLIT